MTNDARSSSATKNEKTNDKIDRLFEEEKWPEAEVILRREFESNSRDHWVLTQLAVAIYEQKRYGEALGLLKKSLEIVPDCPLTLWNLAGAHDALGETRQAIGIYECLLDRSADPDADPCWESPEWAESLKRDCLFRLGSCHADAGNRLVALKYLFDYLVFLAMGFPGTYKKPEVVSLIKKLHSRDPQGNIRTKRDLQSTIFAARNVVHRELRASPIPKKGKARRKPLAVN